MFYDVFCELCKKHGKSPNKAAEEIGLSNSITTKWKKTCATPTGETLTKIAEYFGVPVGYLLGQENKKAPTPEDERLINDKNVLRIAGRDGSYMVKVLTDEQMKAVMTMVDHLPDAYEDL